jgi:Leucine-rich repeat (LRR) protein
MELKNIFKRAPLALIIVGITMLAMNSKKRPLEAEAQTSTAKIAHTQAQPQTPIKIITSDEQEIEIPRSIAFESPMIKNMVQDTGADLIPLNLTHQELSSIFTILQAIKAAPDATKFKREDGKYIAQRIQPIIDQSLAAADNQAIAQLIYAAEFLELEQITNGAIRILVQKALAQNPRITVDNIEITWFTDINWPNRLNPILEYQYQLVSNGNIPELSVKDYIAINGMPEIRQLNFADKNLTSLEGLNEIINIANVEIISLEANKLTTVPTNIFNGLSDLQALDLSRNHLLTLPAGAFNGLTELTDLDLFDCNLTTLPAGLFNGLTNLQDLDISSNQLTTLPAQLFNGLTNLTYLYINYNALSTLPAGLFNGLTNLERIRLNDNELTTLPAGLFNGLKNLRQLAIHRNKLISLPDVIFNGLRNLQALYIHENNLTSLPERLFNGLFHLTALYINSNELTSLPVGIFHGLLRIEAIYINDNQLASLPLGLFNGLGALKELWLENNNLTSLPRTIFSAMPQFAAPFDNLEELDLSGNPGFEYITEEEFKEQYNIREDALVGLDYNGGLRKDGWQYSLDENWM